MTNFKPQTDRKYHRIELDIDVQLTNQLNQTFICKCVDFSEDGIDLKRPENVDSFSSLSIQAGSIVSLQFDELTDAPSLKAAIIKVTPDQIGLRLID